MVNFSRGLAMLMILVGIILRVFEIRSWEYKGKGVESTGGGEKGTGSSMATWAVVNFDTNGSYVQYVMRDTWPSYKLL